MAIHSGTTTAAAQPMRSQSRRARPYGLACNVTAAPSSSTYPLPSASSRPSTRRSDDVVGAAAAGHQERHDGGGAGPERCQAGTRSITCSGREIIMIARRVWDLRPHRLIGSHPQAADAALHIGQKLNVLAS